MNVDITYEKRDISVPKKVAEFLEADRRKIEAVRVSLSAANTLSINSCDNINLAHPAGCAIMS